MATVLQNLTHIQRTISDICERTDRNPGEVSIIAVTKYVSLSRAQEAVEAGIKHLGENRNEGLLEKHEQISGGVSWHFIGTLQTRKVKDIIDKVDYIHSLDRMSLAKEINKRADRVIKCFVQVNVAEEESKHGLKVDDVIPFIQALQSFSNIEVVGLMTMAPHTDDEQVIRHCFQTLRALQKDVQALSIERAPCTELSMGMSNDFHIAIEEGATFIRLGTILVGNEN